MRQDVDSTTVTKGTKNHGSQMKPQKLTKIEKFFDTTWNSFVYNWRGFIILIGFAQGLHAFVRIQDIKALS